MVGKKSSIFSRLWKWIKGLFSDKKEVKINKKTNENSNKDGKNINSPQINTGDGNPTVNINNNPTYNIYNNFPNRENITSPATFEKEKKNQNEELEEKAAEQNQVESREQPEEDQKMSQQEYERLLMKIKFITFGIMGNIKWDKVKPLDFWKEEGEEFVQLVFEIEEKGCQITYEITEEDKQRFLKTSTFEIVERFITLHLVNYGKNNYFDYHCPDCKQTTLTKSSIVNDPGKEAICCNLCGWAMTMKVYLEYLNDKKHNPSLEFYEWLGERNRRMG